MLSQGDGKGFEAWVEGKDDCKRLNEYQIIHHPAKDGESAYTECFLETIDEHFRIKVQKLPNLYIVSDWACECFVDGIDLSHPCWIYPKPTHMWDKIFQKEGVQLYQKSLKFAPLPTTHDEEQVTLSGAALRLLGTIEVKIRRGTWTPSGRLTGRATVGLTSGTASEKGKKFAYSVKAADSTPVNDEQMQAWRFIPYPDERKESYCRFLFKYRPRAVLMFTKVIDEPEAELEPSAPQAGPSRKRKRDERSPDTAGRDPDEDYENDGDVKPSVAKRLKFYEERLKALNSENKRLREGKSSEAALVDLTLIDSDDEDD